MIAGTKNFLKEKKGKGDFSGFVKKMITWGPKIR